MLANLQLISGIPNLEKRDQDFKKWLEKTYPDMKERKEFMRLHYIPDTDLELKNFDTFIEKRKALMMDEFRRLLSLG